jgi:hypothetical protein
MKQEYILPLSLKDLATLGQISKQVKRLLPLAGHQYLCSCREHLSIPTQLRGVVWSIQRILNATQIERD